MSRIKYNMGTQHAKPGFLQDEGYGERRSRRFDPGEPWIIKLKDIPHAT